MNDLKAAFEYGSQYCIRKNKLKSMILPHNEIETLLCDECLSLHKPQI